MFFLFLFLCTAGLAAAAAALQWFRFGWKGGELLLPLFSFLFFVVLFFAQRGLQQQLYVQCWFGFGWRGELLLLLLFFFVVFFCTVRLATAELCVGLDLDGELLLLLLLDKGASSLTPPASRPMCSETLHGSISTIIPPFYCICCFTPTM